VLKTTFFASPFAPSCYSGFYLTLGEIEGSKANKQEIERVLAFYLTFGEIEARVAFGFASISCLLLHLLSHLG
jgi:hypothetical protein